MALLRPPLQGTYENALVEFVGGWSSARESLASLPDSDEQFSWSGTKDLIVLNVSHINQTGLMLLKAVAIGDQAAAEWLADVMSKWWGSVSHYSGGSFVLYGKSDFITLESVNQPWPVVEQSLGLNENEIRFIRSSDTASLQRNVLRAAIQNYWRDISLLTIEILLSWSASENNNLNASSLALYIAAGLLSGRQWRSGGQIEEPLSALTAPGYLTAKARQHAADSTYRQGYIARQDSSWKAQKIFYARTWYLDVSTHTRGQTTWNPSRRLSLSSLPYSLQQIGNRVNRCGVS